MGSYLSDLKGPGGILGKYYKNTQGLAGEQNIKKGGLSKKGDSPNKPALGNDSYGIYAAPIKKPDIPLGRQSKGSK
jgi:hypothetical protein